jgi:hypothetical protein
MLQYLARDLVDTFRGQVRTHHPDLQLVPLVREAAVSRHMDALGALLHVLIFEFSKEWMFTKSKTAK